MKTLNREFTLKEKVLLVVLVLIILGAIYYLMVFQPVTDNLRALENEKAYLQDEIVLAEAKADQILNMQKEISSMENSGHILTGMPSYNAGKAEIDFLHETLSAKTTDYYVGFTQLTRNGNQIRRNFTLNFSAENYDTAKKIVDTLENSEIRCLIGDMVVISGENGESLMEGPVEVNCVATFYETLYGGKEDSDLPEDANKAEETVEN